MHANVGYRRYRCMYDVAAVHYRSSSNNNINEFIWRHFSFLFFNNKTDLSELAALAVMLGGGSVLRVAQCCIGVIDMSNLDLGDE